MKIVILAVVAASFVSLSIPGIALADMMRHHTMHSRHTIMRHHVQMMGGTGGKMAAHRNF